ncbi:hypothetical protein GCM10011391_01560 [Pullulanibacillus camelliae]|uniref:Uncharacterized protein n=1 Tax=Pullulanibacillus camelliae TaxID=1707096 RepID=A0A8J2VKB5_9BACL|nr:hypothetical protein GCM10011391_01560 [Pullulanibacillus camelliae]
MTRTSVRIKMKAWNMFDYMGCEAVKVTLKKSKRWGAYVNCKRKLYG